MVKTCLEKMNIKCGNISVTECSVKQEIICALYVSGGTVLNVSFTIDMRGRAICNRWLKVKKCIAGECDFCNSCLAVTVV